MYCQQNYNCCTYKPNHWNWLKISAVDVWMDCCRRCRQNEKFYKSLKNSMCETNQTKFSMKFEITHKYQVPAGWLTALYVTSQDRARGRRCFTVSELFAFCWCFHTMGNEKKNHGKKIKKENTQKWAIQTEYYKGKKKTIIKMHTFIKGTCKLCRMICACRVECLWHFIRIAATLPQPVPEVHTVLYSYK